MVREVRWSEASVLRKSCFLIFALLIGIVGLQLGLYYFYPWNKREKVVPDAIALSASYSSFPYEAIGTGALALNPHQTWGWMAHLARELSVIAHNSRPDAEGDDVKILLGLKGVKEPLSISSGRTLFLASDGELGTLGFSEERQPLWIRPILLENGRVLIEAGRKLGHLDLGQGYEEKGQFIVSVALNRSFSQIEHSLPQETAVAALRKGHCWGKDALIQHYGGVELASWRDRYKIEISSGVSQHIVFVTAGDYLQWNGSRWLWANRDQLATNMPVALVKNISSRGVEFIVWDESGFCPIQVELPLEQGGRSQGGDIMPTHLRFRTASQISCLFGKKRVLLRQGDWIVRTSVGWRSLRRPEDVENCLQHRLKGELFIFDKLVQEQGRWVLKGALFDEMRTQMQPVSIPMDTERHTGKTKKKKIPFAENGGL